MDVISCNQVIKKYRNFSAVNLDKLVVKENTITGLVGRNGAGKTTLLKMIAGFTKETSGELKVFGEKPFDNLFVSANMIFIDDEIVFPNEMVLKDILNQMAKFYENWDAKLANRLFQHFGFHNKEKHRYLSKGKKSTFNMIVGLAAHTALTIFDEPTTGMDASVRKDFYRALLRSYLANPRTIIISSHHLNEIEDLLEEVILIDNGKLSLHISIDELREYAIGVTGLSEEITGWAKSQTVLYQTSVGTTNKYVVIKKPSSKQTLIERGFKLSVVSPTDIAVYLTDARKAGIDDVFDN